MIAWEQEVEEGENYKRQWEILGRDVFVILIMVMASKQQIGFKAYQIVHFYTSIILHKTELGLLNF
jgi:hypothetical protein